MSDVFISYAREDLKFAERLEVSLTERGKKVWRDKLIPPTVPFRPEIEKGIVATNALIFILGPDSVTSEECLRELDIAVVNGKRLIPLHYREFDEALKPVALKDLNWIDFRDIDKFATQVELVLFALDTDFEYRNYHTWLQEKATEWDSKRKSASSTLQGNEIETAEKWLAFSGGKEQKPTELQGEYVLASRRVASVRQRRILTGVVMALIIAIVLGIIAYGQFLMAQDREQQRATQQAIAEFEASERATQQAIAVTEAARADSARSTAQAERDRAEIQARLALSRQLAAQSSSTLSVNNELALLLAIEAGSQAETFEADSALREALRLTGVVSNTPLTHNVLIGHTNSLNHIAWDHEGRRIATASSDGTTRIWDARNGKNLLTLSGHEGPIWYAAWDPSDRRIVTAGNDGSARIWDTMNGAELDTLVPEGFFFQAPVPITFLAWDPDGKRIATADYNGIARVWDAESGKELHVLKGHTAYISQVTWSPDGKLIATASEDSSARIWNSETGKEIVVIEGQVLGGRSWPVRNVTWSSDGTKLLTFGTDNSALVWDTVTWTQKAALAGPGMFGRPHSIISYVEWNQDATRVVIANGSPDNTAEIWDAETGVLLVVLTGHTNRVEYASWNSDDTQIVTASWDGTARLWEAETGRQLAVLTGHTDELFEAVWSPDNRYVATASKDNTARIWDLEPLTDLPVIRFDWFQFSVGEVAWDPAGTRIAVASDTGAVGVWNAETGAKLANLSGGTARLTHPEWSQDGKWILAVGSDTRAYIWDVDRDTELVSLTAFNELSPVISAPSSLITKGDDEVYIYMNTLRRIARWSPNGKLIATIDWDGHVKIWGTQDYILVVEFQAIGPSMIRSMSWSPDSSFIAIAGSDGIASIWEAVTGHKTVDLKGHWGEISDINWSPDGSRLATSGEDGSARVWSANSGEEIRVLTGHTGWVNNVAWNPDGTRLLSASSDRTARIWNAQTGDEMVVMTGHTESIIHAAWSPDGTRVISASADNTARIWDSRNGSLLSLLSDHGEGLHNTAVVQAVWSPDGRYIATVGFDGWVRIHYASIRDLLKVGCQHAVRNLNETEWKQYLPDQPYHVTCPNLSNMTEVTATPRP